MLRGNDPRFLFGWAIAVLVLGCAPVATQESIASPRLFVLDCGRLNGRNLQTYNLPPEPRALSVPCFLIAHPEGTLLWEGGLGDRYAGGAEAPRDPGWAITTTLLGQLREIGYTPADITYFAMSHSHADHTGNANEYAGSIWLVQESERTAMFSEGRNTATYDDLARSETVLLHGDHDVFADSTVIIKSTPGHTVGHQSLFVRLRDTGEVLLSGDLYHYPEQRAARTFASFEFDTAQSASTRASIDEFLQTTGAQLWIGHDINTIDPLRKSPSYYE